MYEGGRFAENGDDSKLKLRLAAAVIIVLSSLCGYWLHYMEFSGMHREAITDKAEIALQASEESEPVPVNINTAGIEDLMTLPGIGEKKAQNIIEYRDENERFYDISEIKNVKGIGETIYENIEDMITIG